MAEFNFEEFAKEWDEAHLEKDLGPSARTARCRQQTGCRTGIEPVLPL